MTPFLVQVLAMALTVSQLYLKPVEQFQKSIDPVAGQTIASKILKDGCGILAAQYNDPRFNLEILLSAMVTDSESQKPDPVSKKDKSAKGGSPLSSDEFLKKVDFKGLLAAYKLFCKGDQSQLNKIDLAKVLNHYNQVFLNLKDAKALKNFRLPESIDIQDTDGKSVNELYGASNRRIFVPISKIPESVRAAFIAAEDQNFYKHKGLDIQGLLRAFTSVVGGGGGRPQGGSTITQQVAKNLLLNDDLTIDRKMREMLLAAQIEKILTKEQILELYLNLIYLGRSSWGIEMATRSYFGPQASVSRLTIPQAALLAGLTKGPSFYSPDRHPDRARDRRRYVLTRMREDCELKKEKGCLSAEKVKEISESPFQLVRYESPAIKPGYYFLDAIMKEASTRAKIDLRTESVTTIRSTIHPALQVVTEEALREGLIAYEKSNNRIVWDKPEGSIARDIEKYNLKWQDVLPRVHGRHYDVQWPLAVLLDTKTSLVGLKGGRTATLKGDSSILKKLKTYDLVFVDESNIEKTKTVNLKIPAKVQGAAIVLENKTGRVLSVAGGFSFATSGFNRAILGYRQPGSTLKPFVYLAALNRDFQPNTLLPNIPPDRSLNKRWRPQNYEGNTGGLVTFRTAVEQSMNLPTIQVTARMYKDQPFVGLNYVQSVFEKMGIYKDDVRKPDFSEVLGSRETRLIDMANAYAGIANGGYLPTPHFIESIQADGRIIYKNDDIEPIAIKGIDSVSIYQIRRILEGTVARGTAIRLKSLTGIIGAKTGTSNDESDAWFVCFTNDITIAVWVGYDDRKLFSNLGKGSTGGRVALPIAEKILRSSFQLYAQPQKLSGRRFEIRSMVRDYPIDFATGQLKGGSFEEALRLDLSTDQPIDTREALLAPGEGQLPLEPDDHPNSEEKFVLPPTQESAKPRDSSIPEALTDDERREVFRIFGRQR